MLTNITKGLPVSRGKEILPALHNGELRILDTDLAARLGFSQPRDIRKLIARHDGALSKMGSLPIAGMVVGKGQKTNAYYLNEEQALFITAKSETAKATKITIEIVTQFAAFKRGEAPTSKPAIPQTYAEALIEAGKMAMERDEARSEVERHKLALGEAKPKVAALDRIAVSSGEYGLTETAKILQLKPAKFFD